MTHQQLRALMEGNGISLRWKRIRTASADSGASVCVRLCGWHPSKTTNRSQSPPKRQTSLRLNHAMNFTTNPRLSKQGSDYRDPCFCLNPDMSSTTLWLLELSHPPVQRSPQLGLVDDGFGDTTLSCREQKAAVLQNWTPRGSRVVSSF